MNLEKLFLGKNKITRLEVKQSPNDDGGYVVMVIIMIVVMMMTTTTMMMKMVMVMVSCLWRVQGLGSLKKLRLLSIQSNRITVLEGLEELDSLEELYVSNNGIREIRGLQRNVSGLLHVCVCTASMNSRASVYYCLDMAVYTLPVYMLA